MVQQGRLVAAALGDRDAGHAGRGGVAPLEAGPARRCPHPRLRCGRRSGGGFGPRAWPDGFRATIGRRPAITPTSLESASASSIGSACGSFGCGALSGTLARAVLVPSDRAPDSTDGSRDLTHRPRGPGSARRTLRRRRSTHARLSVPSRSTAPCLSATAIASSVPQLVSQSTFRILQALYDIRLRIFEIVIASIGAAVVIGLLMSATIVRPLVRLRGAALALSDRRATPAGFRRVDRQDEIGDLARTLEELTGRLDAHIRLLESFAGDVSHEFKNPLASIRIAAEVIASTDDPTRTPAPSRDADTRCRPAGAAGVRRSRAGTN